MHYDSENTYSDFVIQILVIRLSVKLKTQLLYAPLVFHHEINDIRIYTYNIQS